MSLESPWVNTDAFLSSGPSRSIFHTGEFPLSQQFSPLTRSWSFSSRSQRFFLHREQFPCLHFIQHLFWSHSSAFWLITLTSCFSETQYFPPRVCVISTAPHTAWWLRTEVSRLGPQPAFPFNRHRCSASGPRADSPPIAFLVRLLICAKRLIILPPKVFVRNKWTNINNSKQCLTYSIYKLYISLKCFNYSLCM